MPTTKPTIIVSCEPHALRRHLNDPRRTVIKVAHSCGISCSRCQTVPYVYKHVFFGATNEDEPWKVVGRKRPQRWKGTSNTSTEYEDSYSTEQPFDVYID